MSVNYALSFGGYGDYCEVPAAPSLDMTHQISIEAWAKWLGPTGTMAMQIILNQDFIAYEIGVGEEFNPGRFSWYLDKVNTNAYDTGGSWFDGGPVELNGWTHVALSYDGAKVKTFINGGKVHEFTAAGHIPVRGNPVRIGTRRGDPSRVPVDLPTTSFHGILDEVRLWNVAREETEFREFMNRRLEGSEPGLVGYWNFDEGDGQLAHDLSPHQNHARLGLLNVEDSRDPTWVLSGVPLRSLDLIAHIEPAVPRTEDDLTCIASATGEGAQDPPLLSFRWFKNGTELLNGLTSSGDYFSVTSPSLSRDFTAKGDRFSCRVRASMDGTSREIETEPVVVVNTPPTAPVVRLLPENPSPEDGLAVWIEQPSVDPDGDVILYLFEWFESSDGVNWHRRPELSGNLRPFFPGEPEISPLYTQAAEFWRVAVTPVEADTLLKKDQPRLKEAGPIHGEPGISEVFILPDVAKDAVLDAKDLIVLKSVWQSDPADLDPAVRVQFFENGENPSNHDRLLRVLSVIQDGWCRDVGE